MDCFASFTFPEMQKGEEKERKIIFIKTNYTHFS